MSDWKPQGCDYEGCLRVAVETVGVRYVCERHVSFRINEPKEQPPLVLPTEPTWGIVVCPKPEGMSKGTYSVHDEPFAMVGRWAQYGSEPDVLTRANRDFQTRFDTLDIDFITDFIPLTDEQVARIKAAR